MSFIQFEGELLECNFYKRTFLVLHISYSCFAHRMSELLLWMRHKLYKHSLLSTFPNQLVLSIAYHNYNCEWDLWIVQIFSVIQISYSTCSSHCMSKLSLWMRLVDCANILYRPHFLFNMFNPLHVKTIRFPIQLVLPIACQNCHCEWDL